MFRDVRMRGFQRRTSVEEAWAWIDGLPTPRTVEPVPVPMAADRLLAEDVVSRVAVPGFPRSAMDGWAVQAEATFGATETDALPLTVIGTSLPGRPFDGVVAAGQAVRIMTGAPVPAGADAILRAEDGTQAGDVLTVRAPVPVAKHVGRVGEDIEAGTTVLAAGRRLRPADLGVLSAIGEATVPLHARPRVCLLATGDELLPAGAEPDGVQIVDSNSPMLHALVERDGGHVTHAALLRDDAELLRRELEAGAASADVVLVTGGSSVGEEDHAPRLLHELGTLAIHGVGMRPAAPTGMGTLGEATVFLLPGNPVSCLSAYDFFAGRRIHALSARGGPHTPYATRAGTLARKISSVLGRLDYVRVRITEDGVLPVMARGASILSSVTGADGYVVVAQDSEGHVEGDTVTVHLY